MPETSHGEAGLGMISVSMPMRVYSRTGSYKLQPSGSSGPNVRRTSSACLNAKRSVGFPGVPKALTASSTARQSSSLRMSRVSERKSLVCTETLNSSAPVTLVALSSFSSSTAPIGTSKYLDSSIQRSSSRSVPLGVWNFSRKLVTKSLPPTSQSGFRTKRKQLLATTCTFSPSIMSSKVTDPALLRLLGPRLGGRPAVPMKSATPASGAPAAGAGGCAGGAAGYPAEPEVVLGALPKEAARATELRWREALAVERSASGGAAADATAFGGAKDV
mmetsp:Transcript_54987/g.160464  ORF Transcript_54987/g.160464 Transcript_54987/m.160464 type:complete len:275 (-) Transcript_54987:184-1008(-)